MELIQKLQEIGLTGNESKVYLELTKSGNLSANQIAKNLGLDRTMTYTILNHLIEKGQVSYIIKGKKKIFSSSNPENLLNQLKAKELLATDLIKEIKKIKREEKQDTEVKVYEGKEGLRALVKAFTSSGDLYSFGATGRLFDSLYEVAPLAKDLLIKKAKLGKILLNKKYETHEMVSLPNIEFRYTDVKSEATTSIFGDYVSIHMVKNKPLVILIKNKDIAESYRNYFNFMWEKSKK